MLMCTKMIGFNLNIFVSTGSKTTEYKKILEKKIKALSFDCNIIEDISRNSEVDAIIYSDDSEISDFSIFPDDAVIFSIFAVLSLVYIILRNGDILLKLLGTTGVRIIQRLMGLILMVIAVQFVINGLVSVLKPLII